MNAPKGEGQKQPVWTDDLAASRDVGTKEKERIKFVTEWFLDWAKVRAVAGTVEDGREFWKEVVLKREREPWQVEQWAAGLRWYWEWRRKAGMDGETRPAVDQSDIAERVKRSVMETGARRGLALRTRETYAGWVSRFGELAGSATEAMKVERGSEWLMELVGGVKPGLRLMIADC